MMSEPTMKDVADNFRRLAEIKNALRYTCEVKATIGDVKRPDGTYSPGCPICFVGPKSVQWLIDQFEAAREEARKAHLEIMTLRERAEKAERERDWLVDIVWALETHGPKCPSDNHICDCDPSTRWDCTECHAEWRIHEIRYPDDTPTGSGEEGEG